MNTVERIMRALPSGVTLSRAGEDFWAELPSGAPIHASGKTPEDALDKLYARFTALADVPQKTA